MYGKFIITLKFFVVFSVPTNIPSNYPSNQNYGSQDEDLVFYNGIKSENPYYAVDSSYPGEMPPTTSYVLRQQPQPIFNYERQINYQPLTMQQPMLSNPGSNSTKLQWLVNFLKKLILT